MPEGVDMNDPERLNTYIATLPAAGLVPILLAHLGQAFIGGWAAPPTRALAPHGARHDRGRDILGFRDPQHAPPRLSGLDVN